jgi:hypothetical protein
VRDLWAWVVGLVVLVAASPILICLVRALVVPALVIAVAVIGVRLAFHHTRERW